MALIFCRGCGKEIHDSALSCPSCGAMQGKVIAQSEHTNWMAIVCIILGLVVFISSLDFHPNSADDKAGFVFFEIPCLVLGAVHLHQKKPGKNLSVIGLTFAVIALLIVLGNLSN